MADIELINVSKRFGAVSVIEDLSLKINASELMVFLGPSGCGKSTLLRMIAGLETNDSGEIHIGGERVDNRPPGQRGVAMVFQNYALYPHMKVRENMAFGLENVGLGADEIGRRIAEAARILEIEELLERRPSQLSGGQRQRVAIGRAIVKEPKAFLFDEPLSNLDAGLRVRTRVELAELHQRMSATMIYVTHDQVEAMTLADRIVIMNNRKIEQIGTPMDVYSRPASKFVASFVGSPSMNFAPVSIADNSGGKLHLKLPDGADFSTVIALPDSGSKEGNTLGIRPEAVRVVAPEQGITKGKAHVVEQLGERTLVYVHLSDGTMMIAQDAGSSQVKAGDMVGLELQGGDAHLFDGDGKAYHAGA